MFAHTGQHEAFDIWIATEGIMGEMISVGNPRPSELGASSRGDCGEGADPFFLPFFAPC